MALTITRNPVLQDVKHAGLYNNQFNETGVPYLKETNPNHSQKFQDDYENFNYDDTTEDDTVSPATGKKLTVTNEHVTKDLEVGRDEKIHRDLDVTGNVHVVGRDVHEDPADPTSPLIPNVEIEGTLQVEKSTQLNDTLTVEKKTHLKFDSTDSNKESLQVDGASQFNDSVYINADLYVKGATYDTKVTDLNVGADHITVRDENNASMTAGESAGILINKYDGVDSLGIVASADGTLRVGEYNITHVFTDDNTTYYAEKELINVVDVTGKTLYPIGDQTGTIKEKYFVAKDDTEPLATRAEESDMENDYLTKWNSIDKNIVTSATTEKRAVDTEIRSKSNEARITDLEAGKLNLDYKTEYPVVIEKTVNSTLEQVNLNLAGFVSEYLTRVSSGDTDVYDLESKVQLYIAQNTPVTDFKYDTGVYSYSTDGGNTFTDFANPSIFYFEIGNQDSNTYSFSQNPNSVIRHFDSAADFRTELAATTAGTSENPLKVGNVIHIEDQLGIQQDVSGAQEILPVGAIGITDRIEEGNYDCVTANAVYTLLHSLGLI